MKGLTEDEFNSFLLTLMKSKTGLRRKIVHLKKFVEENTEVSPQDPAVLHITKDTILAKDSLIRELRKGYIDMALIIEQLTTKNLTEEDIKDMKERADRLKESIK